MNGPDSTPEFVERLKSQDEEAFDALVARYDPVVQGVCYSLGLRGADIEDVTTEVFANIYRALPRFRGRAHIGTWVYRIAYRTILAERRRLRKSWSMVALDDQLVGPESLAETRLEEAELHAAIWQTVGQLPPRQAAVVEMHYRRDLKIAEIADILQCPEGTVKTLLYRARLELREMLLARGIRGVD